MVPMTNFVYIPYIILRMKSNHFRLKKNEILDLPLFQVVRVHCSVRNTIILAYTKGTVHHVVCDEKNYRKHGFKQKSVAGNKCNHK